MIILNKKKAQSSVEFVLIASIMFLVFLGMFMLIQSRMAGAYKTRLYSGMEQVSSLVSAEIRMAYSVSGDYSREFTIPFFIEGYNYTIAISDKTELIIRAEDLDHVVFFDQNVSGSIGVGRNLIEKKDENISITPLP
jgi:hypothetical protein